MSITRGRPRSAYKCLCYALLSGGRPARGRIQEREGRILIQYLHAKIQTNMPNALLLQRVSQNLPSK